MTLLSDVIVKRHGIPISAVKAVAQEAVTLECGQHLFRFYQRPQDWSETPSVTELCASLPMVFDINKISPRLQSAKNDAELSEMLRDYR